MTFYALFLCSVLPESACQASTEKAKAIIHWQRIQAVAPDRDEFDLYNYWVEVYVLVQSEFKKLAKEPGSRERLKVFVEQFGKHGAQADFRWLLVHPHVTAPIGSKGGLYIKGSVEARRIQLLLAELQVRDLLANPKKLQRYYQALVWQNIFFHTDRFPYSYMFTNEGLKQEKDYWWHARSFLLLAYGTGREDLLRDVKPAELRERHRLWQEWFARNGAYLRPSKKGYRWKLDEGERRRMEAYVPFLNDTKLPPLLKRPQNPFDDWKGIPSPTDPRELYFYID